MPQINVGSANIITFGFSDKIKIYETSMYFDTASLTEYESGGAANVLGIDFQIKDNNGVTYKDYDWGNPAIQPALSQTTYTLDLNSFGLPFIAGNTFKIIGAIKDANSQIYYTNEVINKVCVPNGMTESGYVPGIFQLIPNCIDNVLTIKEATILVYDSKEPVSIAKDGTLYYPTGTLSPVSFTNTPFSNNKIFTGQNKIDCTTTATYDLGDDIYVDVTYITKQQFPVTCQNFLGDISCCLLNLQKTYQKNCDNAIGLKAKQQSWDIFLPLVNGLVGQMTGKDVSAQVEAIKKALRCDCGSSSFGQNEMTPINPAVTSIVLIGSGGTTIADPVINGDTKTFTIASKAYQVTKDDVLDLAYEIITDTSTTNVVKYKLKFNRTIEAGYILTAIGANPGLQTQLNSLINFTNFNIDLSALNGGCVIDLSETNYFLSYKVISGSDVFKDIDINGTTYTPPSSLSVNAVGAIAAYLNGLGLGTFEVTFNNSSSGAYFNILSTGNANTLESITLTIGGNDVIVAFQKTNKSLIAVLQAIIDYLCGLTALQIALSETLTVCYFDYNGVPVSTTYTTDNKQSEYNAGVAGAICNIVTQINTLTAVTCAKIKTIFPESPLSVFDVSVDKVLAFVGGNCIALNGKQLGIAVMNAVNAYSDVKDLFCAVDCNAPGTCPEISNINRSISGGDIAIYGVSFATATAAAQSLIVRYRVNGTLGWSVATTNLGVFANGNVSGTSPYLITGLTPGTNYDLWVSNNCGGSGAISQIATPTTPIYSGSFLLDTILYNICGETPVTLYSSSPFASGITIYSDIGLTTPVSGYDFIADNSGNIFQINSSTGVVGVDTGSNCSNGTAGNYILGNSTGSICSGVSSTLYTNGVFVVGGTLYTDSALTTAVTGYSYVVGSDNHIYNLNSSTGMVDTDTGLTCTINYELNASYSQSIDLVSGTGIPTLPATGTNGQKFGFQTGMSGNYSITISGPVVPTIKLDAIVNGFVVDCVAITAPGVYVLAITATSSDDVEIAVNGGTC